MCDDTIIGSDLAYIPEPSARDSQLNTVSKEIEILGNNLHLAQKSFQDCLLESTASINALRLRLHECTKKAVDFKKETDALSQIFVTKNKPINKTVTLNSYDQVKHKTEEIQSKLNIIISKNHVSIKRSLMKLSNLVSQNDLLNLPYYELKVFCNQIIEYKKNHVSENSKVILGNMSYSEALQNLEQILKDVEDVDDKSLYCIKKQNNLDYSSTYDPRNFIDDEYKNLPQLSASGWFLLSKVGNVKI